MDTVYMPKDVTVAAGGSADHYLSLPSGGTKWLVEKITATPRVAVAENGTNHWTVAFQATDGEVGTPASSMGGWTTDSDDAGSIPMAVNDKIVITPTANNIVDAGGTILINVDEGGTAPAACDIAITFELRKLRAPA